MSIEIGINKTEKLLIDLLKKRLKQSIIQNPFMILNLYFKRNCKKKELIYQIMSLTS